jgi:hypothetical protein
MACPRCQSAKFTQESYSTGCGWGLLVVGLLLTLTIVGAIVGLPMILLSLFLTARRNRCRGCGLTWST